MPENTRTLLSMVQDILSGLDFDIINHIGDTPESNQVATIIQDSYYNLLRRKPWPWLNVVQQLSSVSDVTQPTKIEIPLNMNRVDKLQYNCALQADTQAVPQVYRFKDVTYLYPDEFLNLVMARVADGTDIVTYITDNGVPIQLLTAIPPSYWTSFDENYIYFDSWDSSQTTTVIGNYTLAYGAQEPAWVTSDSFIPVLPQELFSLLLEGARAVCSLRLRQLEDKTAESEFNKQYNSARLNAYKVRGGMRFYNYGRYRIR